MASSKLSGIKKRKTMKRRVNRNRVNRNRVNRNRLTRNRTNKRRTSMRGGDQCPRGGEHEFELIGVGWYQCAKCGKREHDH